MRIRPQHNSAFTMIETAIALGVIAFALVAILGVLPSGMQVQRDNRQDTIINQDSAYLLEAIRNSAEDIPDLTNFCDLVNGNMPTDNLDVITGLCAPDRTNTAIFRPITGPAVMRASGIPSFRYFVKSEIRQLPTVNVDLPQQQIIEKNQYEVRLLFLWPVLPNDQVADVAQRHVVRTLMTGSFSNGLFNSKEFIK